LPATTGGEHAVFPDKDLNQLSSVGRDSKVVHRVLAHATIDQFGVGSDPDDLQSLAASALAALPPVGRGNPVPVVVPRPLRLRPATT
jgi:hypothetical protein